MLKQNNFYVVKAFSVMEAVFSMVITAIVIGVVYVIFSILSERMNDFKEQNRYVADMNRLSYAITKDIFDSTQMFEKDANMFFERYSGAVVRYEYGELFTVRVQDNFTDTFAIAMKSLKIDTVANKHKRLFLKRLKFQFDVNGKLLDMNFFKRVYPNQLLKAEP